MVVRKDVDASLGKFIRVVGGDISQRGLSANLPWSLSVPLNDDRSTWVVQGDALDGDKQGTLTANQLDRYVNQTPDGPVATLLGGDTCGDQTAEVQIFVYTYNKADDTYSQKKSRIQLVMSSATNHRLVHHLTALSSNLIYEKTELINSANSMAFETKHAVKRLV